MTKKKQSYKLNAEFAAEILSRKKIRPDAPSTQPGDPGNGHVLVVDAEHQKFNGNIYTRRVRSDDRTIRYTYNTSQSSYQLHIEVWKFHNGNPPRSTVIHHDALLPNGNFNTEENNIEYLFLMKRSEHTSYHKTLGSQIQRTCKNPRCHRTFTATNGNSAYCCKECELEFKEVQRLKFNKFVTPEVAKILEESMKVANDFFLDGGHSKYGDRFEIRFCYYCHRPFKTDATRPVLMCGRPDCKGRGLIQSLTHAQNMIVDRINGNQNPLRTFFNEKFGKLDTVMIDGEPWFIGKQVATMLGYKNNRKAIIDHVKDADKKLLTYNELQRFQIVTFASPRGLMMINEFGVHDLIVDSELPEAMEIRHWLTHEVMPALLRTGYYSFTRNKPIMNDYFIEEELMMLYLFREYAGGDVGHLAKFNTLTEKQHQVVLQMIDVLHEQNQKHAAPPTIDVEAQADYPKD